VPRPYRTTGAKRFDVIWRERFPCRSPLGDTPCGVPGVPMVPGGRDPALRSEFQQVDVGGLTRCAGVGGRPADPGELACCGHSGGPLDDPPGYLDLLGVSALGGAEKPCRHSKM
jgi:hypothetical protein